MVVVPIRSRRAILLPAQGYAGEISLLPTKTPVSRVGHKTGGLTDRA